jgi:hypothetical protein
MIFNKRFIPDFPAKQLPLSTAHCPLSALEPNYLTDAVLGEMMETVVRHREGIDKGAIFRGVKW